MKKSLLLTLILFIMLLIFGSIVSFASVETYPECSLLPRYESFGYYMSKYDRDGRQILALENGMNAYVIRSEGVDGQDYIKKLVDDYGWKKIVSSETFNTGYNILEKDNHYIGIAVFYPPYSSSGYIHIYPDLGDEFDVTENVYYIEYPELPMFSVYENTQCIYKFTTPENMVGYAYRKNYVADYDYPILEEVFRWKEIDYFAFGYGYAMTFSKNNVKICVVSYDEEVYVFGFKKQLSESDVHEYVNYGKQHRNYNVHIPTSTQSQYITYGNNQNLNDNTDTINVNINGNYINFDTKPQFVNGRTMVPMRRIFEELGATVQWDNATWTAIAKKGGTEIRFTIDDYTMYKNGSPNTLDVPAQLIDGRTLVPLRAVSEAFGCDVGWDGNDNVVSIISDRQNYAMLYTQDGRSRCFAKADANAVSGWYNEPSVLLYSCEKGQYFLKSQVEEQLRAGWSYTSGHNWRAATCTSPKTCTRCGVTSGGKAAHSFNKKTGKCDYCSTSMNEVPGTISDR